MQILQVQFSQYSLAFILRVLLIASFIWLLQWYL